MILRTLLAGAALLASCPVPAANQPFDGEWAVDLRTPAQKKAKADCGSASFMLRQAGNKVTGEHAMATAGCGRLNEGGERSVVGTARGNTAILLVTSGRNGQVVRGRAMRHGSTLRWQVLELVQAGEPEGDAGLILHRGVLQKVR